MANTILLDQVNSLCCGVLMREHGDGLQLYQSGRPLLFSVYGISPSLRLIANCHMPKTPDRDMIIAYSSLNK